MRNYNIDVTTNTLTITKDFSEKLCDLGSAEYAIYTKIIADMPNIKVVKKTVKRTNKNQTKGLTYDRMRNYIMIMDNNDTARKEFETVMQLGLGIDNRGARFQYVKKWFINKYPAWNDIPNLNTIQDGKIVPIQEHKEIA